MFYRIRKKKSIYDKWIVEKTCDGNCDIYKYDDCILGAKNNKCKELCNNYRAFKKAIISSPTSENIIALHKYLYSDQIQNKNALIGEEAKLNRTKINIRFI